MSTVTLELRDELAAALATPEGMRQALLLIEAEFGTPESEVLDPEMIARGKQGVTDLAAGRVSPVEESHARARAGLLQLVEESQKSPA
jgi:hypothetical protein